MNAEQENLGSFRRQIERWWLGANRAGIQGGAVALKTYIGMATASVAGSQVGIPMTPLDLRQAAMVFLFAFGWHFVDFLAANPMPDLLGSAPSNQQASPAQPKDQHE